MPTSSRYSTPISFHELDVASLKREGLLVPGARVTIIKRYGYLKSIIREATALVGQSVVKVTADGRTEVIRFLYSEQRLGGLRTWLECPRCGARVGKLYGSPFRCRTCARITYPSQRTDARGRALAKAQKLRIGLGGSGSLVEPLPERPWGMWDRTYRREIARCVEADQRAGHLSQPMIQRWLRQRDAHQ